LDRLSLSGDETVLDAGCGSGRVTEMLLERLPRGHVIAVDSSPSMAAVAKERIGDRVDVRVMDLLALELEVTLDAIVSTATFHWIADHDLLFERLRAALRDGGALVAQCGGFGNLSGVHATAREVAAEERFAAHLDGWCGPWNLTTPEQAQASLLGAGFSEARCWLEPKQALPPEPREFLRTVILGPYQEQLPSKELRAELVDAVHSRLGEPVTLDYVRLNIDAVA
jgi:trans-aconitate 2-methyltransferase